MKLTDEEIEAYLETRGPVSDYTLVAILTELRSARRAKGKVKATIEWYCDGLYPGDVSEVTVGELRAGARARFCLTDPDVKAWLE